uniref:Intracellular sulfur oxidation protein, DsrE/DsrF family n=1 Tax=Candidatus Kentrum sp. TC TaxID=2126339 RepID=A0A450ZUE7_9GAMM|nr:MAG: Intracellular sulfur oxidation protein, DsrE/DsrF family [Candidatus Kentron sp. TC]VFK57424.1 MAG: Intracellular sulfur oxidation protein, DsrE/DsrF family [Candidatus Kentron sp. TC]
MKLKLFATCLTSLALIGAPVLADDAKDFWNKGNCPVKTKWTDSAGKPISLDEKFGKGAGEATRCLGETKDIKALYRVNRVCEDIPACAKPYILGNIKNQIADYEITHGMNSGDYKIAVVIGDGWKLTLDNNAAKRHPETNPFQSRMEEIVKHPSVTVLLCQNAAHAQGIVKENMIEGIGFVTAEVSAVADLQEAGYRYVEP